MSNGSAAGCVAAYDVPDIAIERKGRKTTLLRAIPWTRIIVDALLVASILLASSSFLSVR